MFSKLKNHIILINMATTSVVLIISFLSIFLIAQANINGRQMPKPTTTVEVGGEQVTVLENILSDSNSKIYDFFRDKIKEEREETLRSLAIALVVSGIGIEIMVFFLSVYLADESIKPIKETYEAQKQFIANASHEIKTPLAVIAANLEAADIEGNQWIDNAVKKTEELTELNNSLLTLARIESGATQAENIKEIKLDDFIKEVSDPYRPQMAKKKIKFTITKSNLKRKIVKLNEPALRQILNILIDNAIKYCDKKIKIELEDHAIKITNDGTTIAPEKIDHLFERFYQVDKTKNGVGLGLAIASKVAEHENWKLAAASDKKSTTFSLNF